jgi:hypothetical protein
MSSTPFYGVPGITFKNDAGGIWVGNTIELSAFSYIHSYVPNPLLKIGLTDLLAGSVWIYTSASSASLVLGVATPLLSHTSIIVSKVPATLIVLGIGEHFSGVSRSYSKTNTAVLSQGIVTPLAASINPIAIQSNVSGVNFGSNARLSTTSSPVAIRSNVNAPRFGVNNELSTTSSPVAIRSNVNAPKFGILTILTTNPLSPCAIHSYIPPIRFGITNELATDDIYPCQIYSNVTEPILQNKLLIFSNCLIESFVNNDYNKNLKVVNYTEVNQKSEVKDFSINIDIIWKIMRYLKDGYYNSNELELAVRIIADNEKQLSTNFFKSTLDQTCFEKDDYLKLRNMIIDWYAAFKTLVTLQKNSSDAFSQTNFQLNELFKSFGYLPSTEIVPLISKANFFLDLVNFYKIKGTPNTIANILEYYGFSDININEYWLLKNNIDQLVFRPENIINSVNYDSLVENNHDITYDFVTSKDPHWYYTEQQINDNLTTNLISLPSKSPYFSLTTNLYLNRITSAMAIMSKVIRDQYDAYNLNVVYPKNLSIKNVGIVTSLMEVYLATVYVFIKINGYNNIHSSSLLRLFSYNADLMYSTLYDNVPAPINLEELQQSYLDDILIRPESRNDQKIRIEDLRQKWTFPTVDHYLQQPADAESLLGQINPNLLDICEYSLNIGQENELIYNLVATLDIWIKSNISSKMPSLVYSMLGFDNNDIESIINFFKPYRARLIFIDEFYVVKDPLHESVVIDEKLYQEISTTNFDLPTPYGDRKVLDGTTFIDLGICDDKCVLKIENEYIDDLRPTDVFDGNYIYDFTFINSIDISKEIFTISDSFYSTEYLYKKEFSEYYNNLSGIGLCKDETSMSIHQLSHDTLRYNENNIFDSKIIYDLYFTNLIDYVKDDVIILDALNNKDIFNFYDHPIYGMIEFDDPHFDTTICDDRSIVTIQTNFQDKMRSSEIMDTSPLSDPMIFYEDSVIFSNDTLSENYVCSDECIIHII